MCKLEGKMPLLTEEPEVLGVENLGDSSVVFRIVGKCKPTKNIFLFKDK